METLAPGMPSHVHLALCSRGACRLISGVRRRGKQREQVHAGQLVARNRPINVQDFKIHRLEEKRLHDAVQLFPEKNTERNGWSEGFITSWACLDRYEVGVDRKCLSANVRRHLHVHPVQREATATHSSSTQLRRSSASLGNAECFFKVDLLHCNRVFTLVLTMPKNTNANTPAKEADRKMKKPAWFACIAGAATSPTSVSRSMLGVTTSQADPQPMPQMQPNVGAPRGTAHGTDYGDVSDPPAKALQRDEARVGRRFSRTDELITRIDEATRHDEEHAERRRSFAEHVTELHPRTRGRKTHRALLPELLWHLRANVATAMDTLRYNAEDGPSLVRSSSASVGGDRVSASARNW